jgi:hypothetical protein
LLGLYRSSGRVFHGDAFRSAHAACAASMPGTVLIEEGSETQGVVSLGGWGRGSEATLLDVKRGLSSLGFVVAEKALDPQMRDIASRTALGGNHVVGVTVDSFGLTVASLDEARAAHRAFGDKVPFVDARLVDVAAMLQEGPRLADAPEDLRAWVVSAAQEQSVVARRSLSDAISAGVVRGAFVRTDRGQFLVVVSRRGTSILVTAAALHPREISLSNVVLRNAVSECEEVLAASSTCEVKSP